MQSVAEIRKKIEELQAQANDMLRRERDTVIASIKQKMAEFELTVADLGLRSSGGKPAKSKSTASKGTVKYRRGTDQWSGGRGPKPKWVKDVLAKGEDIEKYRV